MIWAPVEKVPDESTLTRKKCTNTIPKIAANRAFIIGPASETSTPWLRGLRNLDVLTGTGLAHPKKPTEPRDKSAGTMSIPTGSTCTIGFRLRGPARLDT